MSLVMNRALRGLGWLFISVGVLVLLYLVYSLLYTNRATDAAQSELEKNWLALEDSDSTLPGEDSDGEAGIPDPGSAVAALEFRRPGQEAPLVHKKPLYVVQG